MPSIDGEAANGKPEEEVIEEEEQEARDTLDATIGRMARGREARNARDAMRGGHCVRISGEATDAQCVRK